MASDDASQKIYPASPTKRKKAREEGQVAKSTELISLITLSSSLLFIYFYRNSIFKLSDKLFYAFYNNINQDINVSIVNYYLKTMLLYITPLLVVILISAFLSNYLQVGLQLSPKVLQPDFKKISMISGFKRMFSMDSFIELAKALVKVTGVLYIVYAGLKPVLHQFQSAYTVNIHTSFEYIFNNLFGIVIKICALLLVLSISDFMYKRYKFEKDLMMTRQEMMDELKNQEGSAEVKQKQREFAMSLTRKQIKRVQEATVVITNPTHYAIALYYDPEKAPIPKVLFKGVDELAQMAKKIAAENNVPMVENRPLARALYAAVNEDDFIPQDMFDAVASVIAYVYSLDNKKYKR